MSQSAYQSELAYLRQMGHAFGQKYPGVAGFLTQQGSDPDVERLLEGFAFLTARIRQRSEDCVPEMAHELAELLMPGYVQPLPAATIVQCDVDPKSFRGRQSLAKHTPIVARPKAGTACQFRAVNRCDLLPLRLTAATLHASQNDVWQLRVDFDMPPGAAGAVFEQGGIRLYCGQPYAQATNLWLALLRHTTGVRVEVDGETVALPVHEAVSAPAYNDMQALWPKSSTEARLVREYLAFASKFLFIDINGLDAVKAPLARSATLCFDMLRPPVLLAPLPKDALRLHCVAAVNLFAHAAVPLRHDGELCEQLLRADGIDPAHAEVYDVISVEGIVHTLGERHAYPAFASFAHMSEGASGRFYKVRRVASPLDGATDTYLATQTVHQAPVRQGQETLSVDLLCTNRLLANQLVQGDLCSLPNSGLPVRVHNITDVCAPLSPPLADELYWRLLAHTGGAHQHRLDAAGLRQRLHVHNSPEHAGHVTGQINARRIQAVRGLQMSRVHRLVRGAPVSGVHYTLTLDEADCMSRGDAYLFGSVIAAMLEAGQPINTLSSLQLVLSPSMQVYDFVPSDEALHGPSEAAPIQAV